MGNKLDSTETKRRPTEVIRDFAQAMYKRGERLNWYEALQLATHNSNNWANLIELRLAIVALKDTAIEIYYGVIDNCTIDASLEIVVNDITAIDKLVYDRLPTEKGEGYVTVISLITMLVELCTLYPEIEAMRAVSGARDITAAVVVQVSGEHVLSIY